MTPPLMKSASQIRKKQFLWFGVGIFAIFLLALAAVYLSSHHQPVEKRTKQTSQVQLAPQETEEEHYKALYETRLRQLEEEIHAGRLREREIAEQIAALRKDRDQLRRELLLSKNKDKGQENIEDGWPPSTQLTHNTLGKVPATPTRVSGFASGTAQKGSSRQTAGTEAVRRPRLVITEVGGQNPLPQKTIPSQALTYLPSGTFAKARLLNGAIAPTRGQGSGNPVPLLLELTDNAVMPNLYRSGIKRCFVTANATGELASERVLVRLDRLSCIDEKGGAVDTKLTGYVSGEDGKTGLRARLVTKSGQAIANALFTGTLSGLGKAVSLAAEESNTSVMGSVTTTVKNPWRAGLGDGASHAMDRITDYYLKLASDMFPVLEVDSGREVEIVISHGLSIERLNNKTP